MDENRFDDMAKTLGAQTTRRLTAGALLAGALGVLGVAETEAARSGKCKPKCGECERCNRGSCRRNRRGRKRCNKGNCQSLANGGACPVTSGGICQNGVCVCPAGQEACGGLCRNLCVLGETRISSTCVCCKATGSGPCTIGADAICCSGTCVASGVPPFTACT